MAAAAAHLTSVDASQRLVATREIGQGLRRLGSPLNSQGAIVPGDDF